MLGWFIFFNVCSFLGGVYCGVPFALRKLGRAEYRGRMRMIGRK
jgi:hypothetical protein